MEHPNSVAANYPGRVTVQLIPRRAQLDSRDGIIPWERTAGQIGSRFMLGLSFGTCLALAYMMLTAV